MLDEITMDLLGFQVRDAEARPIGEVEGIRADGFRLHRLHGRGTGHAFLPAAAVAGVDRATNTIHLIPGIGLDTVLDAPRPPDGAADAWRKSPEWWADLLGHYGLFETEGRGNEPVLHPDQR